MKNYYKTLPKKRVGVGALFFNKKKELLIVKPTYKDYWSIPGGVVDENESPRAACTREIGEEINLKIKSLDFVCVDYKHQEENKTESLQFIFYGGILNENQIKKIKLPKKELSDFKFEPIGKALPKLSKTLALRIRSSFIKSKKVYLEGGR